MNDRAKYNPTLHRLALLTAVATFPLIFMGGLVTSHQAGMSVPDWPNSYGYNMFLFPVSRWRGGILFEHTHRLMGTVVGMLSIALTIAAWRLEPRRWARWLATDVLGAVIFQGVLGGLRVVLVNLDLAIVHACFAQAFFCLAGLTAVITSRWWIEAPDLSQVDAAAGRRVVAIGIVTVTVIYLQLIAGAVMRHYKAGLAVTDLPLIYGHVLPPTTQGELDAINLKRTLTPLPPDARLDETGAAAQLTSKVTLGQIWIHSLHRLGALCVTAAVLTLAVATVRRRVVGLTWLGWLLVALLVTQLTLGVLVVWLRKPADVTSLHVAVGALTLLTAFVLTTRAVRLYRVRVARAAEAEVEPVAGMGVGARLVTR